MRITEIFYSLQGEARTVGLPTVFVRLTGCPLRCVYCDTAYAFSGGEMQTIGDIADQVAAYAPRYVTVTGGEPLAQPNCLPLLATLCDAGYEVSLETGGAMSLAGVDARVVTVLDLKTPASGEMERNDYTNIPCCARMIRSSLLSVIDRTTSGPASSWMNTACMSAWPMSCFLPATARLKAGIWRNGFWKTTCR